VVRLFGRRAEKDWLVFPKSEPDTAAVFEAECGARCVCISASVLYFPTTRLDHTETFLFATPPLNVFGLVGEEKTLPSGYICF